MAMQLLLQENHKVKAFRNYLRHLATELILDDDTLFLAKNGTSLNVSSVKAIVAKYVKKAGIRKKVSVHTLRHTFGAHKADKHMSIATPSQALMGHKKKKPPSNTSTWRGQTCGRKR
jgi:integrase/recombinase XerD